MPAGSAQRRRGLRTRLVHARDDAVEDFAFERPEDDALEGDVELCKSARVLDDALRVRATTQQTTAHTRHVTLNMLLCAGVLDVRTKRGRVPRTSPTSLMFVTSTTKPYRPLHVPSTCVAVVRA